MKRLNAFIKTNSCSICLLNDSQMKGIIGGGINYYFDRNGNFLEPEETDEDNNYIFIQGSSVDPHPLSGFISMLSPSTTYPQSGASFGGDDIDADVFKYLSRNTNVEWAYCYSTEHPGGLITTQNDAHSIGLPENAETFMQRGYNSIMHNHSQNLSGLGYTHDESVEYNRRPSDADKEMLEYYGFENASIFNEIDDNEYPYDATDESQETYRQNQGWNW